MIFDLTKIAMRVFGKVKGVMGSRVGSLGIAWEVIDGVKVLHLDTVRGARPRAGAVTGEALEMISRND